jgi:hypothetical protein
MQKIQQALSGAFKSKPKQDAGGVDEEKGQNPDSATDNWSRRPISAAGISIQTRSSMALHPSVARTKLRDKAELRPDRSAFSWSTGAPTPVPTSHANIKENPLPPLPSDRDYRRDTTLTTISEDSQPTRHRSISSWVANMQTRQEKREERLHQSEMDEDGQETFVPELPAPPPIAVTNARGLAGNHNGSVRLSAMTNDSDMNTPVIQTARTARHVQQGPGPVEVHPVSRSTSRGQGGGAEPQNQRYNAEEQAQYFEGETHTQQDEHSQQVGEYPEQNIYAEQDGEYAHEIAYSQQDDEHHENGYRQQGQFSQPEDEHA